MARWRRKARSAPAPRCPGEQACPRSSSARLQSRATNALAPVGRTAWPRTGSNSENPFAAYSALVCLDHALKLNTCGTSLRIWLNMLHDALTLGLLRSRSGGFGDFTSTLHLRDGPTSYPVLDESVHVFYFRVFPCVSMYRDVQVSREGTTAGMHDYRDVGGRVTHGAVTEEIGHQM